MRVRSALASVVLSCSFWVACSSSGEDAQPGGGVDSGADASFGTSACFACLGSACAALPACSSDPGCGAYLACAKACGNQANGAIEPLCEAECHANAPASAALDATRACVTTGSGCSECGASSVEDAGADVPNEANSPNPALTQECSLSSEPDVCTKCVLEKCCDSADEILGTGPGAALNDCMNECDDPATYDDCEYACVQAHPDGVKGYGSWFACYGTHCSATHLCSSPDVCTDCLFTTCGEQRADCYTDTDCLLLYSCTVSCEDAECGVACFTKYPAGQKLFGDLLECDKTCPC
jgi:hypothetical protein